MELEKVAKIDLEEEAYLKPVSDRGIGFYNLDKNTAKFQFRVTKDNLPLLISTNNVKGYAFFRQITVKNGDRPSTSGVLDVEFIDPMTGLIGVTVPPWFLKSVTNSTVLGEIYLSLNDYKNEDKDDTVVLGTFQFEVKDSLVNQISSDIKVSYIRMFDDLRDELEKKVEQLKKDIGSTQSLIDTIKQLSASATQAIQKAKDDSINSINTNKNDALNNIEEQTTLSLAQIDSKKNDVQSGFEIAKTAFQNSVDQNTQTFANKVNDANTSLDQKINNLQAMGALTKNDVDTLLQSYTWQKYQLTNDNGYIKTIMDTIDLNTMVGLENSGFYYLANAINTPEGRNKYCYLNVVNQGTNSGYATYREFNSNVIFINTKYGNVWKGWQRINQPFTDTDWVDLQLVNGATPGTSAGGFKNAYRVTTIGSVTRKMIRINATSVKHGQTIAILPKDFVKSTQYAQTGVSSDKYGGQIIINTSGTVEFNAMYDSSNWNSTDLVYCQYEWTE